MSTVVALKSLVVPAPQKISGFTLQPSAQSPRLLQLEFSQETVQDFLAGRHEEAKRADPIGPLGRKEE